MSGPMLVDTTKLAWDEELMNLQPGKFWRADADDIRIYPTPLGIEQIKREEEWRKQAQVQAFRELYEYAQRTGARHDTLLWEQAYARFTERQLEIFDTLKTRWIIEHGQE